MKRAYSQWVLISVIATLAVLVALYVFLKQNKKPAANSSPTPSASSTTSAEPTQNPSPETSPSPSPTGSPTTNADQAKAAYQKGDYSTAITKYKLAITETKDAKTQAELWNLLGNSYRDNKNTSEAITSYNQATKLDANLIAAYINLSNVYVAQNKNDMARSTLEKGLKANPANKDLERELSIVNLTGTDGAAQ